jgi:hypothetical protein
MDGEWPASLDANAGETVKATREAEMMDVILFFICFVHTIQQYRPYLRCCSSVDRP